MGTAIECYIQDGGEVTLDLETMLRHGRGRAVLFLREQLDASRYRSIIWGACSENWSFDSQLEDARAPYLYDVIHATGEPLYYVERIVEALDVLGTVEKVEPLYPKQLICLAALLTKNGVGDLRGPMYRAVGSVVEEIYGIAHIQEEIIALDGIAGYWRLVEWVRRRSRPDEDRLTEIELLDELSEQLGKTVAEAALRTLSANDTERRQYLDEIQKICQRHKYHASLRQRRNKRKTFTLADVRAYVNAPAEKKVPKPRMKHMHKVVQRRVWLDFKSETDRVRQLRYVDILQTYPYIPFPGKPEVVLPLIRQRENERLALQAARLLDETTDVSIRTAALELVTQRERVPHALQLLVSNPGEGDRELLEDVVQQGWEDRIFEAISIRIRRYIKNQPSPQFVPILLTIYEKLACSYCRGQTVKMLLEQDALPAALRAECYFDADGDTRELFRSA